MSTACPTRDSLTQFNFGHLEEAPAVEIATHVDSCANCQTLLLEISGASEPLAAALRSRAELPFIEEAALQQALPRVQAIAAEGSEVSPHGRILSSTASFHSLKAIRDYEILEKLGEGGMGAVYKARHSRLKKIVALKILPPDRVVGADAIARFEREMEAVGKLEHPHLVRAMDAGEADGTHFLVMEYVGGSDLSQLAKAQGPLAIADACELIRQAAVGLQHVHEQGLVHRDIKPSNLMLSPTGNVKILDLGLALLSDEGNPGGRELTASGQMMGTIDYMAPEQGGDTHYVDIRADIYSLGASLYKLLSGVAPFGDPKFDTPVKKLMALAVQEPIPIRDRRPEIPAGLAAVVAKMLAKEPKERYETPADVATALAPFTMGSNLVSLAAHVAGSGTRTGNEDTYSSLKSASVDTLARKISPSPIRPLSPWPLLRNIAIGVVGAAAMLAAIVFYVQTKHGAVKVTINDPSISVKFTKTGAVVEGAGKKPIDLQFGEQTIEIRRGDFKFTTSRFKLEKKGVTTLDIEVLPGELKVVYDGQLIEQKRFAGPPQLAAARLTEPNTHELQFAGSDKVEIPSLIIDRADPVTFEAFVTPEAKFESTVLLVGAPFQAICIEKTQHWQFNWISDHFRIVEGRPVELGKRLHIAGVRADDRMELFVDGKSTGKEEVKPGQRFSFAVAMGGDGFVGRIDEVRVSSIARYDKNFPPPQRFETDDQTIALYHCDEGQGTELKDSSGNGHHGKIVGAKWVKVGPAEAVVTPSLPVAPYDGLATGQWIPLLRTRGEFDKLLESKAFSLEDKTNGTPPEFSDGVLLVKSSRVLFPDITAKNGILRARVKKEPGRNIGIWLRHKSESGPIVSWYMGNHFFGAAWYPLNISNHQDLWISGINRDVAAEFEFAIAVVDDRVKIFVDGELVSEVRLRPSEKLAMTAGHPGLSAGGGTGTFRDIEFMSLDVPPKLADSALQFEGKDAVTENIDLLAAFDVERASSPTMKWTQSAGSLVGAGTGGSNNASWNGLKFPTEFGGDYDFELQFKQEGYWPLQFDLPLGDRALRISLAGDGGDLFIDGKDKTASDPPVRNEAARLRIRTAQTLTASVRQRGEDVAVAVTLDGMIVGQYSGKRTRIVLPHWVKPNLKQFSYAGLGDLSKVRIEFLRAVVKLAKPEVSRGPIPASAKAPFNATEAKNYQQAWADYLGTQVETENSVGAKMVLIPPGEFLMGSSDADVALALKIAAETKLEPRRVQRIQEERPQHLVRITKPFRMGIHEVTIGQFGKFIAQSGYKTQAEEFGGNYEITKLDDPRFNPANMRFNWRTPGQEVGENWPVTQMSWNDAVAFCNWLSEQENLEPSYVRDGDSWMLVRQPQGYRLPTEAEWEYACRAGTTTQFSFGDDWKEHDKFGWSNENAGGRPRGVGLLPANPFGLYDMHGNAFEWCHDWYDGKWYERPPSDDPRGPVEATFRVGRGGGWSEPPSFTRSSYRCSNNVPAYRSNGNGFRIALSGDAVKAKVKSQP